MKAIVHDAYGATDVLQLRDIDKPVVKDDELLILVRAASAYPADWHFMRGQPKLIDRAGAPGHALVRADGVARLSRRRSVSIAAVSVSMSYAP
jgi:NADPH:quinone reductase-like Zn-dependent oxidoreductase